MSKPIDQEREAFEAWYARKVGVSRARVKGWRVGDSYGEWYAGAVSAWEVWQVRASVQPAGVERPEGYVLVPSVADLSMKNAGWQEADRQGVDPESIEMQTIWHAMLAAAPHPVSGEQKPVAVVDESDDGQWAEILPDVSVRVGDKLYAAPPAAQDVAGLAEAVRDYLSAVHEQLPNPLKVTAAMLQMKKALAAHRAQQGEQP